MGPGRINWGSPSTPTDPSQVSGARINWGSALTSQRQANAVIDAQNRRVQQSRQQEQQLLQQQQQQPKPSFLSKALGVAKSFGKGIVQSEQTAATGIARVLPGGTNDLKADQAQATSAVNTIKQTQQLVKSGKMSPAVGTKLIRSNAQQASKASQDVTATEKAMPSKGQLAAGFAGTAADIITAGALPEIKGASTGVKVANTAVKAGGFAADAGLNAASAGGTKKQIVENAAAGVVLPAALSGIGKAKQVFLDGPKALLDNVKTNRILNAGEEANKPVKIPVTDASPNPEAVNVRAPLHPPINEVKTADTVTVRTPQQMSDQEFTKQFNALSKNYEKDTKFLQQSSPNLAPKEVQALSDGLEAKHQGKLNDLIDAYNNPKLSEPVAPKPIKVAQDKIPTPRPAKAATEVAPAEAAPVGETAPKVTTTATSAVAPAETVKVPKEQLPVGTGQARVSRLEARMQGSMQNLTEEQRAGLSTYKQMNKKENISAAAMYVEKHPDEAMQVLRGEKNPPNGIAHNSVFLAMDAKGMDDPELARKLASLRSTRAGQEISLLTEANPHSPASAMSNLRNIRIEARGGEPKIRTQRSAIVKEITTNMPKVSKDDWSNFVESLRC